MLMSVGSATLTALRGARVARLSTREPLKTAGHDVHPTAAIVLASDINGFDFSIICKPPAPGIYRLRFSTSARCDWRIETGSFTRRPVIESTDLEARQFSAPQSPTYVDLCVHTDAGIELRLSGGGRQEIRVALQAVG